MALYITWQCILHDSLHYMTVYITRPFTLHDRVHYMMMYITWQCTLHRSSDNLSTESHGKYRHSASSSSSSRHRINPESRGAAMQLCLPPHPVVTCSQPQTYNEMMAPSAAPTNGMGSNGGSLKSPQSVSVPHGIYVLSMHASMYICCMYVSVYLCICGR